MTEGQASVIRFMTEGQASVIKLWPVPPLAIFHDFCINAFPGQAGGAIPLIDTKHTTLKNLLFQPRNGPNEAYFGHGFRHFGSEGCNYWIESPSALWPLQKCFKNQYFFNICAIWCHQAPPYTRHTCHLWSSGFILHCLTAFFYEFSINVLPA